MSLHALGLTDQECEALRRNGFVSAERHHGRIRYKLRFRVAGKQRVRLLGSDANVADAMAQELTHWQAHRRLALASRRVATDVARSLGACKRLLSPHLESNGYYYHGRTIRRRRVRPSDKKLSE